MLAQDAERAPQHRLRLGIAACLLDTARRLARATDEQRAPHGLPAELQRAVEIHRLAGTATEALTRLADLGTGDNQAGSMGQLCDILDRIRGLPCIREARGVAEALAFARPDVAELIEPPTES